MRKTKKEKKSRSSVVIIYMEYVCEGCVFNFKVFKGSVRKCTASAVCANANAAHLGSFFLSDFYGSSGSNVCHQCVLLFILVRHVFCISSSVAVSPLGEGVGGGTSLGPSGSDSWDSQCAGDEPQVSMSAASGPAGLKFRLHLNRS